MTNGERSAANDTFIRNGEVWISFEGGEEDTTIRPTRLSRAELARLRKIAAVAPKGARGKPRRAARGNRTI
jgi:hypothetical protein